MLNEKAAQLVEGHGSVGAPRQKRMAQDAVDQLSAGSLQLRNYQRLRQ